jgi:phosphoribosylaminoimidazole-succinocarboxamide synthase
MLYEGKAKIIYATEDPGLLVMKYKDEATALDGAKKGTIANKGLVNNRVSCLLFKLLEQHGVATHLVKQLDERSVLVKRMQMIPLEVVVRNVMAGSLAKKLGQEEGQVMAMPVNWQDPFNLSMCCSKKMGTPLITRITSYREVPCSIKSPGKSSFLTNWSSFSQKSPWDIST